MFVEIYGPLIYGYCRRQRLSEADAADVSQEVLTRLAKAMHGFEYQAGKGGFRKWLGTITHNELVRFYTKRQRLAERHPVAQEPWEADALPAASDWSEHFQASLLQVALARIETEFDRVAWVAFQRVWIEDVPAKEVADQLAIAIEKIYVSKSRILKRLREEILALSEDLPVVDGGA
jgi:RNA polymerase sigma-70 factor (ECF subfamily)